MSDSNRNGNRKQLVDLQDAMFDQIDRLSDARGAGSWKPRQPWRNVPADRELRLAVIAAAVAAEMAAQGKADAE